MASGHKRAYSDDSDGEWRPATGEKKRVKIEDGDHDENPKKGEPKTKNPNDPRASTDATRLVKTVPVLGLIWKDEQAKDQNGKKAGSWIKAVYHNDIRQTLIDRASHNGAYQYESPRASGTGLDDVTSYHAEQGTWRSERQHWDRIRDDILHRLYRRDQWGIDYVGRYDLEPTTRWYEGDRIVIDEGGKPLTILPDLPDVISSQVEGWLMAAWLRLDDRISRRDIWARTPRQYTDSNGRRMGGMQLSALGNRYNRFMQDQGLPAWERKKDSCPLLIDRLPEVCKQNNSTRPEYGGSPLNDHERHLVDEYGKGQQLAKAGNRRISDSERARRMAKPRQPYKKRRNREMDNDDDVLDSYNYPPASSLGYSSAQVPGTAAATNYPYGYAPANNGNYANDQDQTAYPSAVPPTNPGSKYASLAEYANTSSSYSNGYIKALEEASRKVYTPQTAGFDVESTYPMNPTSQSFVLQHYGNHGPKFGGQAYNHGGKINETDPDDDFSAHVNKEVGPSQQVKSSTWQQWNQTLSKGNHDALTRGAGQNTQLQPLITYPASQPLQSMKGGGFKQADSVSYKKAVYNQQAAQMQSGTSGVDAAWDTYQQTTQQSPTNIDGTVPDSGQQPTVGLEISGTDASSEHNPHLKAAAEFDAELKDHAEANGVETDAQAKATKDFNTELDELLTSPEEADYTLPPDLLAGLDLPATTQENNESHKRKRDLSEDFDDDEENPEPTAKRQALDPAPPSDNASDISESSGKQDDASDNEDEDPNYYFDKYIEMPAEDSEGGSHTNGNLESNNRGQSDNTTGELPQHDGSATTMDQATAPEDYGIDTEGETDHDGLSYLFGGQLDGNGNHNLRNYDFPPTYSPSDFTLNPNSPAAAEPEQPSTTASAPSPSAPASSSPAHHSTPLTTPSPPNPSSGQNANAQQLLHPHLYHAYATPSSSTEQTTISTLLHLTTKQMISHLLKNGHPGWVPPAIDPSASYADNLARIEGGEGGYTEAWGQVWMSYGPRAKSGQDGLSAIPPRVGRVVRWDEKGGWGGWEMGDA